MDRNDRNDDDGIRFEDDPAYEDRYEDPDYSEDEFYDETEDDPYDEGLRDNGRSRHQSARSRRKRMLYIQYAVIGILAVIVAVAIWQIASQILEYRQASQEYDNLSSLFEAIPESGEEEEASAEESLYPALSIDFDALREINSEFVGILHIPALDLTYPVAQASNNTDYLTKTFEGTTNSSGCIYLDAYSSADFIDWNTFIYGHNMKNQTMFGSLKLFLQDEELANEDPYIYIYQEDQVLIYRIFAYYTIEVDDDVYNFFYDEDAYDAYVSDAFVHSQYALYEDDPDIDWSARPNLLTLSTCYGSDHTHNFIVQGALVNTVYTSDTEEAE